jgi:hypothetical protein
MRLFRAGLLAAALSAAFSFGAHAQTAIAVTNGSRLITTGNTYQTILPALGAPPATRRTIQIQNNNASDACYLEYSGLVVAGNTTATSVTPTGGSAMTAQQASAVLAAGGSWFRSAPYIPSGAIVMTCASNGDSVYVEVE